MKTKKSFYTTVLLTLGIILLANLLSTDYFARLDLTESKSYTLSTATEDILENLVEPVTVKAYFSENLPPAIETTRQSFKDLLIEYANISAGNIVYEFINPNESDEIKQEAIQAGINPIMINVREKDQMKQQEAYMGAIIQMGDQQEVIPFMQPGEAMEYTLTTSIKKISVLDKPAIAFIKGHGEAGVSNIKQGTEALKVLYNVEDYYLNDSTSIPDRFKTIAIVAPEDSIGEKQLKHIDDFMKRGGNVLVAYNKVKGDLQTLAGTAINTGLEDWLSRKGIVIENKFLLDANCLSVQVQQSQGFFRMVRDISFPYLPKIEKFADHPITRGLEFAAFPFISPLSFDGDSSKVKFTPLAFSSERSATQVAPAYFDIQKQWQETDFPLGKEVVAAAFEGKLFEEANSKIVVIGDGDFVVNAREEEKEQPIQADNLSFFVNSIDWLSDDTGLVDLRTKGITSRPIDELDDATKSSLKYGNFLAPILLVVLYGLFRMQKRKSIRIKRMEENYE